jgi:hypothetical protein
MITKSEIEGYEVYSGSRLGEILGFTEELFYGWLEILENGRLYLYYISSKNPMEGNATRLIKHWIYMGFEVRIVRPCPEMRSIIEPMGFMEFFEDLPHRYTSEHHINVWRIPTASDKSDAVGISEDKCPTLK